MRFTYFNGLTAVFLLADKYSGTKTEMWTCDNCGLWLKALDLEGGLVAVGSFDEETEYYEHPYFGWIPVAVQVVLKRSKLTDRHKIKCERCGVINRRHRKR